MFTPALITAGCVPGAAPCAAMLAWQPLLPSLAFAALLLLLGGCMWAIAARIRSRLTPRRTALVAVPKAAALALLAAAMANPSWVTTRTTDRPRRLLALLDVSSSMDVRDDGAATRRERAERILGRVRAALPGASQIEAIPFDTVLREPGSAAPPSGGTRGTDVAGCLRALARRAPAAPFDSVILLSDGGDLPLDAAALPPAALHIVGIGADPDAWDDAAVADVTFPATVEKGARFTVEADCTSRFRTPSFAERLAGVRVALERWDGTSWRTAQHRTADLGKRRARASFRMEAGDAGVARYRVAVEPVPGEVSALNNTREFTVETREKALHVLFFSRELGADFKMIRGELGSDAGLSFTALYRTVGDRFTVQGQRIEGDEVLESGFPSQASDLRVFDCIVVGAFPAADWSAGQMGALAAFAEAGGSVVFLGGDRAFGQGGYASTRLADLLPWRISASDAALQTGEFEVSVPANARDHPVVTGVQDVLSSAERGSAADAPGTGAAAVRVESLNPVGDLKPGAVCLLQAAAGAKTVPVAAVQRFGKGWVLAVASNTLWKWARKGGPPRTAYGRFWRQAVRALGGKDEGGRLMSVAWDRTAYRPGDTARVEVSPAGSDSWNGLLVAADVAHGGARAPLPLSPVAGRAGTLALSVPLPDAGQYEVTLSARRGEALLETYARSVEAAFPSGEGARLELNAAALNSLAELGGGTYAGERDADRLIERLRTETVSTRTVAEWSPIHGSPLFAALFVLALTAEWVLRRRVNLL